MVAEANNAWDPTAIAPAAAPNGSAMPVVILPAGLCIAVFICLATTLACVAVKTFLIDVIT